MGFVDFSTLKNCIQIGALIQYPDEPTFAESMPSMAVLAGIALASVIPLGYLANRAPTAFHRNSLILSSNLLGFTGISTAFFLLGACVFSLKAGIENGCLIGARHFVVYPN